MMASFPSYAFQRSSSVHCSSHSRCCALLRLPLPCTKRICCLSSSSLEAMADALFSPVRFSSSAFTFARCFWMGLRHTKVYRPAALSSFVPSMYTVWWVCFAHVLQFLHKLIEQILHHFPAAARAETCKCRVIRRLLILQQPSEIDPVLTGFLQLPAGIDPTQISMYHDLEQHPWIRCRFSPPGRIRFVQFPVLQFLKLCA